MLKCLVLRVGKAIILETCKDIHEFIPGKQEEIMIPSLSRYIATSKGKIHDPTLIRRDFHA
jgi:hypothetical protein